jgi:polyisoprenoid-binding protein YceI
VHYAINPTPTTEVTTVRYAIQSKGSSFTVRAFATGLLSAFGHSPTIAIRDFEGEVLLNPDALEKSSLHLLIHAASLSVTDDIKENDRQEIDRQMHENVLESDGYPEISYACSKISSSKTGDGQYWVALSGELTMHGVTHSQPVSARVAVNGDALRATGEFSVLQSDYDIRPVSAVGGTVKLKDELKLSFDISASKQV